MHVAKIFLLKGKKPFIGLNIYLSNNEQDQASSLAMRASHGYMGKLLCNKDCSEFCLLDNGVKRKSNRNSLTGLGNVKSSARAKILPGNARRELLHIKMTRNKLAESRNREMEVLCPRVAGDGSAPVCYQQSAQTGAFSALKQWPDNDLTRLTDKQAEWHQEHRVLNFHGRVTRPSIKNFQLEQTTEATRAGGVVLQCGRTGKHTFIVDFSWPLSPIQAFSIALCKLTAQ